MSADQDGDSQMQSSSSESDASDMFPTADDPPTPKEHPLSDSLAQLRGSGLSPPNSQERPSHATISGLHDGNTTDLTHNGIGIESQKDVKEEEHEPGWAWNNKQAVEEFHRVMEIVADKGFNLRENYSN